LTYYIAIKLFSTYELMDVPMPPGSLVDRKQLKMDVGDSVLIRAEKREEFYNLKNIVGPAARYYGAVTGKKFKTLKIDEENGVRVWRIE
jgi:hypothetical protein